MIYVLKCFFYLVDLQNLVTTITAKGETLKFDKEGLTFTDDSFQSQLGNLLDKSHSNANARPTV